MDKIDEKILLELISNSRKPILEIAKKTNTSREIVNYRINKLKQSNIITDFTTNINLEKLGYISALLFITIDAKNEKAFMDHIKSLDYISWSGLQCGKWSLGMAIYGENQNDIESKLNKLLKNFQDEITEYLFEFYKNTEFFYEKYFQKTAKTKEPKTSQYKLDKTDKKILSILSKNSRISCVEISKQIPITAAAIAKRIKNLEQSNYILGYTIYINTSKISLFQFYFFLKNRNLQEKEKFENFLRNHKRISTLITYIGNPFTEICIFEENPYNVRTTLQQIRTNFPETEITDFFLTQEDLISYGLPQCVFN